MFESRIIEAAQERDVLAGGQLADVALPLRELSWTELVARLSATRDLRGLLAAAAGPAAHGSFDVATADQIAGSSQTNSNGLPAINPDALGNSKYAGSKDGSDAAHKREAEAGDRGNA
ncbi:hypothetical protein [Altererythrobacter sp. ZODW24]|uniref:hypothetical protein n=1 Tax=Altererythrobacter sp. ZODW24 TaxID=2185142 RepID=UPI000DF7BE1C|nr:hypothetical protein [Altererythrobacter sp. ZODW24]